MADFWIYFKIGLHHVLDINAYDHVLFLMALAVPYEFRQWKPLLILITAFTLGHSISLFLAVFNIVSVQTTWIEFLIPITILIAALYNLLKTGKSSKNQTITFIGITTLFFGLIHGLGFSSYFNSIIGGQPSDKLLPLVEFALGIESAQILVVIATLLIGVTVQALLKYNKRDWILILSSFVMGISLSIIIANWPWKA